MDTLVAAAIHDAKNSLHALDTWLARARAEAPSPALEQACLLSSQINAQLVELLALYRADRGRLQLNVNDHFLADFVDDLLAELVLPAPAKVVVECDRSAVQMLGAWAFDAYLVKFVLLDALRNAARHARHRVRIELERETGGGLRICVGDDGPGFPAAVLEGATAAMDADSSGLGLAFARLIADRHATPSGRRGRVELGNRDGARFSLILP
ncbi:MAG: sensor histidine kinase [Rhodocyclaceae bacterium]|nr:sensor histidine kinase [Rhodocyclaceae bacterium]